MLATTICLNSVLITTDCDALMADHGHYPACDLLRGLHGLGHHRADANCVLGYALQERPGHSRLHDGRHHSSHPHAMR